MMFRRLASSCPLRCLEVKHLVFMQIPKNVKVLRANQKYAKSLFQKCEIVVVLLMGSDGTVVKVRLAFFVARRAGTDTSF